MDAKEQKMVKDAEASLGNIDAMLDNMSRRAKGAAARAKELSTQDKPNKAAWKVVADSIGAIAKSVPKDSKELDQTISALADKKLQAMALDDAKTKLQSLYKTLNETQKNASFVLETTSKITSNGTSFDKLGIDVIGPELRAMTATYLPNFRKYFGDFKTGFSKLR